jgi:heme/copper-type cytochrome/quinol oxidase subunit 4
MATCPSCGGFLDEHHQCAGMWRQRLHAIGFALAGAILGVLAVLTLAERPTDSLIVVAALLGAVVVTAVMQSVQM